MTCVYKTACVLSIIIGVCAVVLTVLIGLCPPLVIVLRGVNDPKDRQLVVHALRELIVSSLAAVAQLPGKLAQSLLDVALSARGRDNLTPPLVEPSPALSVISSEPAPGHDQIPGGPRP